MSDEPPINRRLHTALRAILVNSRDHLAALFEATLGHPQGEAVLALERTRCRLLAMEAELAEALSAVEAALSGAREADARFRGRELSRLRDNVTSIEEGRKEAA